MSSSRAARFYEDGTDAVYRSSRVNFVDDEAEALAMARQVTGHGAHLTTASHWDDAAWAPEQNVYYNNHRYGGQYQVVNPVTYAAPAVTTAVAPVYTSAVAPVYTSAVAPAYTTAVAPVYTSAVAPAYSTEFTAPVQQALPLARYVRVQPAQHTNYALNYDATPLKIVRRIERPVVYRQNVEVRYLRPPTPPPPAPIIVRERRVVAPAPPPLVVVQRQPQHPTPPPLTIRERPPAPPVRVQPQIIEKTVAVPPPPRQVIIERVPAQPPKPRRIIVEKWLPYKKQVRQVIHQKLGPIVVPKPRNVIVEYERPRAVAVKEISFQGVFRVDPATYNTRRCEADGEVQYVDNVDLSTIVPAHQIPAVNVDETAVTTVAQRVEQPQVVYYRSAHEAQVPVVAAQPVETVTLTRSPSYESVAAAEVAAPVAVRVVQGDTQAYDPRLFLSRDTFGRLVIPQ